MRLWHALALTTSLTAVGLAPRPPADGDDEEGPYLAVSGHGEVAAQPDRAVVVLGATAQEPNAASAQRRASTIVQQVVAAIRETGVPEEHLQTAGLSLEPVYSEPQQRQAVGQEARQIVAYRASHSIRVRLDDPASAAAVIDAGITAGANTLDGLSFELSDDTTQRSVALRRSVRDARAKAEVLAEEAGVTLLAVERLEEQQVAIHSPGMMARAGAFEASTPVQPGLIRVDASVLVRYRIAPGGEAGEGQGR